LIEAELLHCRVGVEQVGGRQIGAVYTDEARSAYTRSKGRVDALQQVDDLAEERASAELWVAHSHRLTRAAGRLAAHAVELAPLGAQASISIRALRASSMRAVVHPAVEEDAMRKLNARRRA